MGTVLLFSIFSCWATSSSTAQSVKIVGIGSADCATFVKEISQTKAEEWTYFAWAQGYKNGLLIRAPVGVDENLDLTPPAFPIQKQADFVSDLHPRLERVEKAKDERNDMSFFRTAIVLAALAVPAAAFAQAGGHTHDAPNGGQIQTMGNLEGELVVKGSNVILYVVDAKEQKFDASKPSASAVILAKGNQQKVVELKPGKENHGGRDD